MPTTALLDEKRLLLLVADGDHVAYQQLFNHYWNHIFTTTLVFVKSREIAQDLTQDIFARIWIKREKLKEVEQFQNYLFIVSRNLIFDRLRKKVLIPENKAYLEQFFEEERLLAPDYSMELRELEEILYKGIDILPNRQRVAFYLSRFKGLRHKEIAIKMGISQESVKSHIMRAAGHLRKYLAEHSNILLIIMCWLVV